MNALRNYVNALSEQEIILIIESYTKFEEAGFIGDSPIRNHARYFCEKCIGVGVSSQITSWMEMLVKECFRRFAMEYIQQNVEKNKVYWLSPIGGFDDFDQPYNGVMIDGKTKEGPWACMTQKSWEKYGVGRLGQGFGQKYVQQANGRWLKVEG